MQDQSKELAILGSSLIDFEKVEKVLTEINEVMENLNVEDAQKYIAKVQKEYGKLIVTEDTVEYCKKDRAFINNVIKTIEDKRKKVKRELSKPAGMLDMKCKELIQPLTEIAANLKEGLDVFEQKRKDDKMALIIKTKKDMATEAGLTEKYVDRIEIHERWLNKTVDMPEWEAGLRTQITTLIDVALQEKRNKETLESHIATMNETFGLEPAMKLEDFVYVHHNDFETITGAIDMISRTAKRLNEAKEIATKKEQERKIEVPPVETVVLTPMNDTITARASSIDIEDDIDWKEVCYIMAETLADQTGRTAMEIVEQYKKIYLEEKI